MRTIEDVWIVLRWQPIELKDVEQVIELAVHVAAGCDVSILRDADIHQRRCCSENLSRLWHRHKSQFPTH